MTSSIQNVGEEAAIINDSDLLILIGMMMDKINPVGSRYSALTPYARKWDECRLSYGPGTLDLELDSLAKDLKAKSEMNSLLSALEERVGHWGDIIPADTANEKWHVRGVRFYDYQTSRIISAIERIRALMS